MCDVSSVIHLYLYSFCCICAASIPAYPLGLYTFLKALCKLYFDRCYINKYCFINMQFKGNA